MAEFYRSRLNRKQEEEITKKTVLLGLVTIVTLVLVLVFGLPFLVKFSVLLGEAKNRTVKEVKDNELPPLPPRLVLTYEATRSSIIRIPGFAEPKSVVELVKNDVSFDKVVAGDEGDFVFENVTLEKGDNIFTAITSREDGGSSELSQAVNVVYDDEAPELTMINPVDDGLKVDVADFDVMGKSEKGVSVTVNNRLAMVDDEGNFKIKFQLNAGKNELEIKVSDIAGNETRKMITITYDF